MKNVFYFKSLNIIGGVETFFYYLSKKYRNMVVYYRDGDARQIERLSNNVEIHKYKDNEKIKCDRFFCNYYGDIIDNVDAKEYIQIIHADYKEMGYKPKYENKITKYIGVSQVVCDSFKEITGHECELIYNPVEIDPPEDMLLIVSATRLTEEKGKENIEKIGRKLNELGKPYVWLIFTNDYNVIKNPNIIYMPPRLDISSFLQRADIVAQLSRTEAFGFTPNEALKLGTPVLLMDLPIWKELGIKDGVHGWIIDDIDKFDVNTLYKHIPKFKFELPKDKWDKYLDNDTNYNPNEKVHVICKESFHDLEKNIFRQVDTENGEFDTTRKRYNYLKDLGLVEEKR